MMAPTSRSIRRGHSRWPASQGGGVPALSLRWKDTTMPCHTPCLCRSLSLACAQKKLHHPHKGPCLLNLHVHLLVRTADGRGGGDITRPLYSRRPSLSDPVPALSPRQSGKLFGDGQRTNTTCHICRGLAMLDGPRQLSRFIMSRFSRRREPAVRLAVGIAHGRVFTTAHSSAGAQGFQGGDPYPTFASPVFSLPNLVVLENRIR